MHSEGRDLRGCPKSRCTGGWRRLPKRFRAVTVGYTYHRSWHLPSGRQWLRIGWAPWMGGTSPHLQCIPGGGEADPGQLTHAPTCPEPSPPPPPPRQPQALQTPPVRWPGVRTGVRSSGAAMVLVSLPRERYPGTCGHVCRGGGGSYSGKTEKRNAYALPYRGHTHAHKHRHANNVRDMHASKALREVAIDEVCLLEGHVGPGQGQLRCFSWPRGARNWTRMPVEAGGGGCLCAFGMCLGPWGQCDRRSAAAQGLFGLFFLRNRLGARRATTRIRLRQRVAGRVA